MKLSPSSSYLFPEESSPSKLSNFFEFLGLFLPLDLIEMKQVLSNQYLDRVSEFWNLPEIKFVSEYSGTNAWYHTSDSENEFDKRSFWYQIGKEKEWFRHPFYLKSELQESGRLLSDLNFPMLLKQDGGFSGKGNRVIRSSQELEEYLSPSSQNEWVLEPLFQRNADYSLIWTGDEFSIQEQLIGEQFEYRGVSFKLGSNSFQLSNIERDLDRVLDIGNQALDIIGNSNLMFSIDFFQCDKNCFSYFSELNFRMSLTQIFYRIWKKSFSKMFPDQSVQFLMAYSLSDFKNKTQKTIQRLNRDFKDIQTIQLSPENSQVHVTAVIF